MIYNTYKYRIQILTNSWQVIWDNKAKQQPFPTKIWCWTRCSIIVECSLTEINLRRANGHSPPLESALIDWRGVLVQSKVGTITVICVCSDGPPCGVELRWVLLSTDQPAMTKRGSKARHGFEECMMGCRCSTGTGGIDWEDWQWLKCLLLSKNEFINVKIWRRERVCINWQRSNTTKKH